MVGLLEADGLELWPGAEFGCTRTLRGMDDGRWTLRLISDGTRCMTADYRKSRNWRKSRFESCRAAPGIWDTGRAVTLLQSSQTSGRTDTDAVSVTPRIPVTMNTWHVTKPIHEPSAALERARGAS